MLAPVLGTGRGQTKDESFSGGDYNPVGEMEPTMTT